MKELSWARFSVWLFFVFACSVACAVDIELRGGGEEKFMFLINSDPQMGEADRKNKGIQVLNQLLREFVQETNERDKSEKPAFVVWNGDLVWKPYPKAFANFESIVKDLTVPSVLVHGNHDGKNHDPQFLDLQEHLSGYRHLNYAFDYGKWHFVVIASQPKYNSPEKKEALLAWLDRELKAHQDQPVMLFMHYHLLPVGLSQMEYYSYTPAAFRKQVLDTVTRYGNVKYVFSGHVHSGVKSSVKASREYKGTRFVVVPTPVMQRPFGEEYPEFSDPGRFDKRGFYLEVHIDGENVKMIGRKIQHPARKEFPEKFKAFTLDDDPRSFLPESQQPPNKELLNGGFGDGLSGWQHSYRYRRDKKPMFINKGVKGANHLHQVSGYGSWNFDEYEETYQVIKWHGNRPNTLSYHFTIDSLSALGAGGYIRVFSYLKNGQLGPVILFHWGAKEEKVMHMPWSWFYNATGERSYRNWVDERIAGHSLASYALPVRMAEPTHLDVDLNALFTDLLPESLSLDDIEKVVVAHGVWTRVRRSGHPYHSQLTVDAVRLSHEKADQPQQVIRMNGKPVDPALRDGETPYAKFGRTRKK